MNYVLGPDPPMVRAILMGEGSSHCKVPGHSAVICAQQAEAIEMPFGLWAQTGPRNHVLDGGLDPPWVRAILGERVPIVKYSDFLS